MADSAGDKKHLATDRRRRQAREEGQVVKSQDLTSAGLLLASLASLWALGGAVAEHLVTALQESLSSTEPMPASTADASQWLLASSGRLALAAVPLLIAMFTAGVLVNVI